MSEPSIPPLVAWMSRHGVKVLGIFILIELAFHSWAVRQSREPTAAATRVAPIAPVDPRP